MGKLNTPSTSVRDFATGVVKEKTEKQESAWTNDLSFRK